VILLRAVLCLALAASASSSAAVTPATAGARESAQRLSGAPKGIRVAPGGVVGSQYGSAAARVAGVPFMAAEGRMPAGSLLPPHAEMAKSVDATVRGTVGRKAVGVRLPASAPRSSQRTPAGVTAAGVRPIHNRPTPPYGQSGAARRAGVAPAATRRPQTASGGPRRGQTGTVELGGAGGLSSWYCAAHSACTRGYPAGGFYAAAGPELRRIAGPRWMGRRVRVAVGGHSVVVRLVDWCRCPGGRLIDLYSSVWRALGVPLSRGLVMVSVEIL
jgi:hypothetical protein